MKPKLKGEALTAISGYQLSNSNYKVVVEVLKQRFGNTKLIIDAHYRSLSHLPMATRQCFDTIERHLHSLEAVGQNVNYKHFVALISEKLPPKVLYQLYMLKGDDEPWTVPKLQQLVVKHITALEMAGGKCHHPPSPTRPKQYQLEGVRHPYPKSTASGLLAGNSKNQVPKRHQIKCVYCSNHTGLMNVINSQHCNPQRKN